MHVHNYTMLTATDQKSQIIKSTANYNNIAWLSMLLWLTLPFYGFRGFWSIAVDSVNKVQFLGDRL